MYLRFFSVLFLAAILTACGGDPQQQTLSSDPQNTELPSSASASSSDDSVSTSTGGTSANTEESVSETRGDDNNIVPGSVADFQNSADDTIYFETDQHFISDKSARALRAQARWLRQYPEKRILIEGNCDERGTREYNYALGNRRAFAVRDFLISQGVPSYRIKTVSYGKDKPEFLGANETAWSLNRRAVTVITE